MEEAFAPGACVTVYGTVTYLQVEVPSARRAHESRIFGPLQQNSLGERPTAFLVERENSSEFLPMGFFFFGSTVPSLSILRRQDPDLCQRFRVGNLMRIDALMDGLL